MANQANNRDLCLCICHLRTHYVDPPGRTHPPASHEPGRCGCVPCPHCRDYILPGHLLHHLAAKHPDKAASRPPVKH